MLFSFNELMIDETLKKIIKSGFYSNEKKFLPGKSRIPLAAPSYGPEEIIDALETMISGWVTMGEKVKEFERLFCEYVKTKYSIMVNSGSSANLLALSVLTNPTFKNKIPKNSYIITPAVTWSTTVSPIINVGCKPLFVDVDLDTLCIDINSIKDSISEDVSCIMPVHLMGYPCNMEEIMKIASQKNLQVVEDACEAPGATINSKKVGTFGDIGTFSFFLSHHITTMEGGMLITDNEEIFEIAKSLRTFGWVRDLKNKEKLSAKNPAIDPRFLFVNLGFNFRPTELQGAFGKHQIRKLDNFIKIRRENAKYWNERLSKYSEYVIIPKKNLDNHVFFGYAITIKENASFSRNDFVKFLESKGIETRPIMAGNFVQQPVSNLFEWKKADRLSNSELIMKNSFFIGNHHKIGEVERQYVADQLETFLKENI